MRICIDAREVRQVRTGLGRYALNLVQHLAAIDRQNEYFVLRRATYPQALVRQENFVDMPIPYGISTVRNMLEGGRVINPLRVDIYHALFHLLPLNIRAARIVLTLHDLIWVTHADISFDSRWRQVLARQVMGRLIGKAVSAADHVISISESTRQAAVAHYALPVQRYTVVHHGIDPAFCVDAHAACLPAVCKNRRFIFSLGNTKPYKNIPRLLQAFRLVVRRHPDLFLVVSGRGDGYALLARLAYDLGIDQNVCFIGQLSDAEVQACFARAVFFAFPSLIEGFGFPVVEAMASGCPVLTSNTSSMPEVAGDAAVYVDPINVDSIAAGMLRLIEDPCLRKDLTARGRLQAANFSWRACAQKTLDVYQKLTGRNSVPPPVDLTRVATTTR